jgi:hypothetical protein
MFLRFVRSLGVAAAMALLAMADALAGQVIAHASVELSKAEVRDVFLGEKQLLGNLKLVPVNNVAALEPFLARVLQTDEEKYRARWTRKSFREGLVQPATKGSDAEVLAFVRSTPGAVGYINGTASDVKVLADF